MKKNIGSIAKYIIIGVVATIILELLAAFIGEKIYYSKYNNEDTEMDKYYYSNSEKIDLEMGKYTESKDYVLDDGSILVEVTNNNDYAARGRIYIEFFDENNETITIMDQYINYIGSAKKSYFQTEIGDELKKLYKTYKVKVVLTYNTISGTYYDDVKLISFNKYNGNIIFKNNTKKKLDGVVWGIIYYDKDDKIIGYSTEYAFDVKAKKTVTIDTYIKDIQYNRIEVVLLEAYDY